MNIDENEMTENLVFCTEIDTTSAGPQITEILNMVTEIHAIMTALAKALQSASKNPMLSAMFPFKL